MSSPQGLFNDNRVNDGTAVRWIEDKFVAGLRVKTELRFVQRQEATGGNRAASRKNEWTVHRAVANEDVAIERNVIGGAVRQFDPEYRIGYRRDFVEGQR